MAELGDGPYKSGAVAAALGRRTTDVSVVRQRLLDKGLVYATEDYGHVDFTVPRFGEFMIRHMPYRHRALGVAASPRRPGAGGGANRRRGRRAAGVATSVGTGGASPGGAGRR